MGGFMGFTPKAVIWESHDLMQLLKLVVDEDDPHITLFDAVLFRVLYCTSTDEIVKMLS
jgi:hypothetical protein